MSSWGVMDDGSTLTVDERTEKARFRDFRFRFLDESNRMDFSTYTRRRKGVKPIQLHVTFWYKYYALYRRSCDENKHPRAMERV